MPGKIDRNQALRLAGSRRVPVVRSQSYFSYNKCVSVVPIAQIFGVREHTHEFFELVPVARPGTEFGGEFLRRHGSPAPLPGWCPDPHQRFPGFNACLNGLFFST